MNQNGYSVPATGHVGKIPNYGKTQVNPMGYAEAPACIQNAMLTKDKKPFTYTPGGLDLSQIKTPSMARRMARQRSLEEQEQNQRQIAENSQYNGGYVPPPPPAPPQMPIPPPPPPLKIEVSKSPKPVACGERPEIVIPDNPIGMLRKTNSPYHWESEKAHLDQMGHVPKFTEKVPNPLTVKMPPSNFSQQPAQCYNSEKRNPDSPLHRPAAQYSNSGSPKISSSEPVRQFLQRQDSQFNKSPQPFGTSSPVNNTSSSPLTENDWRQPNQREFTNNYTNSPRSPQNQIDFNNYSPTNSKSPPNYLKQPVQSDSGNVYHTLPRIAQRNQNSNNYTNNIPNNAVETGSQSPKINSYNTMPWKQSKLNHNDNNYLKNNTTNNNSQEVNYSPPWVNNNNVTANDRNERYHEKKSSPWEMRDNNNNQSPVVSPAQQSYSQPRYQSTINIPVTPKKSPAAPAQNNTQKEIVYVTEEPVYYCPESPKSVPPWMRTQKEKTQTPPPAWCQRPLDRVSTTRDLTTPPKESSQEPEWVKRSNEMQRTVRDVVSPPRYQETSQPSWSTIPSENRKSLPRDNEPPLRGSRVIPIQIEGSNNTFGNNTPPNLRITIGVPQNSNVYGQTQATYSQPTQRIMKVLSPTLVRLDNDLPQKDFPKLNHASGVQEKPKTRIIPIKIEGGNNGANNSFGGRY